MTDGVVWTFEPDEAAAAAERQKARRDAAERDEQLARAQDSADQAEYRSWLSRLRGEQIPDVSSVLARARDDGPDRSDAVRRQAARRVLAEHGLDDVIPGGPMTIMDANVGVVEPSGRGSLSRSAPVSELDDPRIKRAREKLADASAVIARARSRRESEIARAAVDTEEQRYRRACAEIGQMPAPARRSAASQDAEIQRLVNTGFSLAAARAATL